MQITPCTLGFLAALAVLTAGCSTGQNAARHPTSPGRFARTDALEPGLARKNYVDSHYRQVLKAGRATNDDQARAVAGLDWDSHEPNRDAAPAESYTWSSDDARKRRQQEFENDLANMQDN